MAPALVLLAALTVVMICFGSRTAVRRSHTPLELRGDWWERFEREFRAYASRTRPGSEWAGPERRRHPR